MRIVFEHDSEAGVWTATCGNVVLEDESIGRLAERMVVAVEDMKDD